MRKTGSGQSPQCFRKKKKNGLQASKNASQLDTTTATELANAFSSGMPHPCDSRMGSARNFFGDGSVAFVKDDVAADTFVSLITRGAGDQTGDY